MFCKSSDLDQVIVNAYLAEGPAISKFEFIGPVMEVVEAPKRAEVMYTVAKALRYPRAIMTSPEKVLKGMIEIRKTKHRLTTMFGELHGSP